jgi:hypothetical protein
MVKTFNSGQLTILGSLPPVHICFLKPFLLPHSHPLCSKLVPQENACFKKNLHAEEVEKSTSRNKEHITSCVQKWHIDYCFKYMYNYVSSLSLSLSKQKENCTFEVGRSGRITKFITRNRLPQRLESNHVRFPILVQRLIHAFNFVNDCITSFLT